MQVESGRGLVRGIRSSKSRVGAAAFDLQCPDLRNWYLIQSAREAQ